MRFVRKNGAQSNVFRFTLRRSDTGQGLTGLTSASSGLIISTIADTEASATTYTAAGSTIETIATLGTYAAPTATKCRFKEVDPTNHPGLYELQLADARFAVASSKQLNVTISGAATLLAKEILVQLTAADVDDAARLGLSALPNAAANANGGLPILSSSGTTLAYTISTLTTYTGNTPQTGDAYAVVNHATYGNAKLVRATTPANTLDIDTSHRTSAMVQGFLATAITETSAGNIAGCFTTFWDQALTNATVNSLPMGAPGGTNGMLIIGTGLGQVNMAGNSIYAVTSSGAAIAPASTALSTATWTAARAGYLDNLNVGGAVASHADVLAINQSASKHLLLATVGQYEAGETYTVECRTFSAADGSAVNADTTPTLTATGTVSGSLNANLSAATNPATGVYRWTYTPGATPTLEQIRFDVSATIATATFTLSAYSQTVDLPTAVFTATDQAHLTAIFNKLPTNAIADETLLLAAIGTPMQAGTVTLDATQPNYAPAKAGDAMALTGDFTATMKTSLNAATPASVTGAVGSVTGNVGGISGVTFPTNFAALSITTGGAVTATGLRIEKNTALSAFPFAMVDSTDHVTPKTGLTITATRSIDGAAFAACANTATEVGNGIYVINLAATDLNGNTIVLRFTGTGADDRLVSLVTQTP